MDITASIVIITKNQRSFLERSLVLCSTQTGLLHPIEIIVVDSGSTDGARAVVRSYPGVRLIEVAPERFNYARAYNAGMMRARGQYLVRLSGDALPASTDWLAQLLCPFRDPGVAATWGRQILPEGVVNPLETWTENRLRPPDRTQPKVYTHDVTVLGSGMAIRADLWRIWPFDERMPQAEDYAWMHHWYRYGRTGVFVPSAAIRHGHSEPLGRALRRSLTQSALQGMTRTGLWELGRGGATGTPPDF